MSEPCGTCLGGPDCLPSNDLNLMSLDSSIFQFVPNCPPGFDCFGTSLGAGTISFPVCNQVITRSLPAGLSVSDWLQIIGQMLTQAAQAAQFCSQDHPIPPLDPTVPVFLYFNRPQSCSSFCPDGAPFTYTVGAGRIIAFTQEDADAQAYAQACFFASRNRICLLSIPTAYCGAVAMNVTVSANGPLAVFPNSDFWEMIDGSLPTGVTFNGGYITGGRATITGTPTTGGDYTFTIRVTTASGSYQQKTYAIRVLNIDTASPLTAGQAGAAYSQQLTETGGTDPVLWSISSGSLPAGLTMDGTGLITGTPTSSGTSSFTVQVDDDDGLSCTKDFTLTIGSSILLSITPTSWNPGDTINYVGLAPAYHGDLFQIDWTATDWDGRGNSASGHFNDVGGQFDGTGHATMVSLKLMRRMFTGGNGLQYWGAGPCTLKIEDTDQSPSVFSNILNRTVVRHAAISIDGTLLAYILAHPDLLDPYTPTGTLTEEFYGLVTPTAQYEDTGTAVGAVNQTIGAPKGILYSPNGVDLVIAYLIAQGGGHAMLTYQKLATDISNPTGVYTLLNDPNGDAPANCTIT